jgi:hypothetical protein
MLAAATLSTSWATAPGGSWFIHAVDASEHSKTGQFLKDILAAELRKLPGGPASVVAIVTDSASNCKKACDLLTAEFPHIIWWPCTAHQADLFLEKLASHPAFADMIKRGRADANFVRGHGKGLSLFRAESTLPVMPMPTTTRTATPRISLDISGLFSFWFVVSLGRMLGLLRYPFFSFFSFYFITKVSAALTVIWVLGTEVCFTAACQAVVLRPNRSPEVLGMKTNSGLSNDTVRLRLFLCNSFLINNDGRWPCQRIIQRIFALRVTYRTYSTYGTYGTQFTYFYNPVHRTKKRVDLLPRPLPCAWTGRAASNPNTSGR